VFGPADAALHAQTRGIAPRFGRRLLHDRTRVVERGTGRDHREPTVGDAPRAFERRFRRGAEPNGNRTLDRHRRDTCAGHLFVRAVEAHRALRPQQAQQLDLLLTPAPAVGEVGAERVVLDLVPAETYTEP